MLKNYSLRQWVTPWCRLALAAVLSSGSYAAHALAGPQAAAHHAPAAKPLAANDAAVTIIYSYGRVAAPLALPHTAQAVVTNAGTATLTNLPVTLNVTGSTTFTNTQTVASLAPGASTTVTFAGYSGSPSQGSNLLTVTVPADDNSGNNSATFIQRLTPNRVSYIDTTQSLNSSGATIGAAGGAIAVKYTLPSAFNVLSGATINFAAISSTSTSYQVLVYDANGTGGSPGSLLYTSATLTRGAAASTANVAIANVQVGTTFFLAIKEINNGLGLATQPESPVRPATYYVQPGAGTAWQSIAASARFALSAVLGNLPTCVAPSITSVTPASNSATVAFAAPSNGTQYKIIYVLAGTTPNASSPSLIATGSPATITGLIANTSYDIYVQSTCSSTTSTTLGPYNFRTACPAYGFPYSETFDGVTAPTLPCGATVLDANGDARTWVNTSGTASSSPNALRYSFSNVQADDWFFTPSLTLVVGKSYQVEFRYRANVAASPEGLEVKVGNSTNPTDQTATLYTNTNITNIAYATTVAGGVPGQVALFTPTTAGQYNFGFHAISAADQSILYLDDIKITEVTTPACPIPTGIAVSSITTSGATIAFTGTAAGTSYTVVYVPRGTTPTATSPSVTVTSSPATLTGLTQNTAYDVYVRTTCGTTGTSTLTGPLGFITTCATVSTYPYTENFDGVTAPALPCGVTVLDVNADGKTWVNTSSITPASTPNAMRYTFSLSNAADDWFFTNGLNMVVGKSYQLEFKYRAYSATFAEGLEVKLGTAPTVASQTTTVFSNTNIVNTTFATSVAGSGAGQVLLVTPTTSGTYYFGFHAISGANKYYLDVDDVKVTETVAPACPAPTSLTVTNATTSGATVSFTGPTAGTAYTIVYVPRGTTPTASSPSVAAMSSPVTLTGLNGSTAYDVYVRATCGTLGTSTLTGPVSFTTLCANSVSYPYIENFDGVTAPALPCGVTVLDVNADGKTWANTSGTTPASTPNAMRYTYSSSNAANDWFFTAGLPMQAGGTYQLEFKYRAFSASFAEGLEVRVGTGANVAGQSTTVFSNTNIVNTAYATTTPGTLAAGQVVSFTPTTTGTYYFGFHAISGADQFYLDVDNVNVTVTGFANCPTPTALAVSNILTTSATVTFNGPSVGTSYKVIYVPAGTTPTATSPSVTVSASPATITGLTANKAYDVYVLGTCGSAGNGAQAGPVNFTTACQSFTQYPYNQNFDAVTAPALPCGITTFDANADGNTWATVATNPASSPNAMRYSAGNTAADDWFFTEALPMQTGMSYQLQFKYRAGTYTEKMEVKIGSTNTVAAQTTTLFTNTRITNTSYTTTSPGSASDQVASFTPATNGNYYVGFHAISAGGALYLYVDDISISAATVTSTKSNVAAGFRAEASPVPFSTSLTLNLNTLQAGPLQLTLRDAVGRVLRQTTTTVPTGASSLAVPDAGALPAGIYLLTVQQGGNTQVIRVAHE